MPAAAVISGMALVPGEDVCKTPVGPAPVPTPYPNMLPLEAMEPLSPTVAAGGFPMTGEGCAGGPSQGDDAGVEGGVVSEEIMGEGEIVTGAPNVLVAGRPVGMQGGSTTVQNTENAPGDVTVVGQENVQVG